MALRNDIPPIRPEDRIVYNGYGSLRGVIHKQNDGTLHYMPFGNDIRFTPLNMKVKKSASDKIKNAICWLFGW